MNKLSLPKWLPPKESSLRIRSIIVLNVALAMIFIVLPGIGFWVAFHDGDWLGLGLVALIYGPLLGYLGVRKLWRSRKKGAGEEASRWDWNR